MTNGSTAAQPERAAAGGVLSTDVVIVGGGPAGLAAAIELGRRGVRCVVIEPRVTVDTTRPRAKTTSTRTMEHLRRWGIADRLRAAAPLPVEWSQDVIFADSLLGAEITRFRGAFGLLDETKGLSPETGQQAPQPVVEEVLRAAAAELDTVTFLYGCRVTGVEQDADGVRATVERTADTADTADSADADTDVPTLVAGRYLFGCDGSGGNTRRAIGAAYQGSSNDIPNLSVLFRAPGLAERVRLDPAVQYWIINPAASGLMGRLDLVDTWWAIVQSVSGDLGSIDPYELIRSLLGGVEPADLDCEVIATDPWNARMLLVDRYRDGRIFLVGDAAHLNPPWGGHGFNTCLGDAVNLGWKVAAVLQGWGDDALLDSYELERRPVAAQTIADAGAQEKLLAPSFVQAAGADTEVSAADARTRLAAALQDKQGEFHSAGLVLGYHYAGSPVVVDDGSPAPRHDPITYHGSARPGARLPHAWLDEDTSVLDLVGPGFTVLHAAGVAVDRFTVAAAETGVPLGDAVFPAGIADQLGARVLLVRPDQHIAWRADDDQDAATVLAVASGRAPAPDLVELTAAGHPASRD